jgi:hypothetical protein
VRHITKCGSLNFKLSFYVHLTVRVWIAAVCDLFSHVECLFFKLRKECTGLFFGITKAVMPTLVRFLESRKIIGAWDYGFLGYDVVGMSTRLHNDTSQKTALLIFTSMTTSDLTKHSSLITVMRMGLNKFNSLHHARISPVV